MNHLGIIMDGNGRWAKAKGQPRTFGHEAGARALCRAIEDLVTLDIDVMTVYAFSTENSSRDKAEVAGILGIIAAYLTGDITDLAQKHNLKLRFLGNFERFPDLKVIKESVERMTSEASGKTVAFAIGYGGIEETLSCVNRILNKRLSEGSVAPITEQELYSNLYTAGLPLPDAILRYGGYKRLSNFLPLQSVYSELFFIDKLWPDYDRADIENVIEEFAKIKRNFGGVG